MNSVTNDILDQFESFRQPATTIDQYDTVGKPILAERIDRMVASNQPIKFAMLGFPFKSTNTRDKVLSQYPDLAEDLTLKNFAIMNNKVKQVYAPGMSISMLSDGYVFNDLLDINDSVAREYLDISMEMSRANRSPVEWYSLDAFYNEKNLLTMREKMNNHFGITEEQLQYRIMYDNDVNYIYRGMIIFLTGELAMQSFTSGKARERAVKALVRKMMLRNEAYDNMVRHVFKDHIRLSMHKSVNNGKKYSIKLIDSPYAKHSAWHSAIVLDGDKVMTMHKKDAICQGYEIVNVDGQPFYFTTK